MPSSDAPPVASAIGLALRSDAGGRGLDPYGVCSSGAVTEAEAVTDIAGAALRTAHGQERTSLEAWLRANASPRAEALHRQGAGLPPPLREDALAAADALHSLAGHSSAGLSYDRDYADAVRGLGDLAATCHGARGVRGSIAPETTNILIGARGARLQACYDARRSPDARGDYVALMFVIEEDGSVSASPAPSAPLNTVSDRTAVECMLREISAVQFAPPREHRRVPVMFPIKLGRWPDADAGSPAGGVASSGAPRRDLRSENHPVRLSGSKAPFLISEPSRWATAVHGYVAAILPGAQPPEGEAAALFAQYVNAMHARIHPIFADAFLEWLDTLPTDVPMNASALSVTLEVGIDRDGRVGALGVLRSSGLTEFDIASLDSVDRAQPFPLPPKAILSTDGRAYVRWEFRRDEAFSCSTVLARPLRSASVPAGN